jgi:hypothetical protein
MHAHRFSLRPMARLAVAALAAAALSAPVLATGPTPDPPVPPETLRDPVRLASAEAVSVRPVRMVQPVQHELPELAEPDCRCSALFVRDLSRRIEGHVERWESLPRTAEPAAAPLTGALPAYVQLAAFVDGVVGFPLHDNRLAE